jgi:hypothetical protein
MPDHLRVYILFLRIPLRGKSKMTDFKINHDEPSLNGLKKASQIKLRKIKKIRLYFAKKL